MSPRSASVLTWIFAAIMLAAPYRTGAQQDYGSRLGTVQRGGRVTFEPQGPGVLFDALDPAVRKWFVPQELYNEYRWKSWEYTNYARDHYRRYVDIAHEGTHFYDMYGNLVTRGWLIYDFTEDTPQQFGSRVFKTTRYRSWFSNLLIASDARGEYYYTVTIGDEIRTTLTPMTFSKPAFNGIQFDFAADKYECTLLLSRPSRPAFAAEIPDVRTSVTNLLGGRGVVNVGDFVKLGGTFVTAFQTQTLREDFLGSPFTGGSLTTGQNAVQVSRIIIRLSDDSPEDGVGGAALFDDEIIITDLDGNTVRGSDIGFEARREGGFQRVGYLAADGDEQIFLTYDFTSPRYLGPDPSVIKKVSFELVISNDYRVEMTSDRQTNADGQPVFLMVKRAAGNIQDNSNQTILRFDYGLPTANTIYGFTLETMDLMGFDFYGEYNINHQYRRYPNVNREHHSKSIERADAWMMNVSRVDYPWFVFGEAYSMDDSYSTRSFLVGTRGEDEIDYENELHYIYEFVDNNDNQSRYPDWQRFGQKYETLVFPGWDSNNNFLVDFNQNDNPYRPNFIPDYEEPFLRYHVDRPEFLFGIDMNNNLWIDRFENDDYASYPYPRDHRGYNLYGGVFITPEARLTIGRVDERLMASDNRNKTHYFLFTYDDDFAGVGRLRVFEYLRLAKDDIPNDLVQWVQPPNSRGTMQRITDPLAAQNTWINSFYIQLDYREIRHLNIINKCKFDYIKQREDQPDLRELSTFLGIINKADYIHVIGEIEIEPRWKSEFLRWRPVRDQDPARLEMTQTLSFLLRFPLLNRSMIEAGFEFSRFDQFRDDDDGIPLHHSLSPDSTSRVFAMQLHNRSAYLGYELILQTGFRIKKETYSHLPSSTTSHMFVTAYAGMGN